MPEDKFASKCIMTRFRMTSLNIETGFMPEEDDDFDIHVSVDFHLKPSEESDLERAVAVEVSFNNDEGFLYEVRAAGEATFLFDESTTDDERKKYLLNEGHQRVFDSINVALESVSALFPYGPVSVPPMFSAPRPEES